MNHINETIDRLLDVQFRKDINDTEKEDISDAVNLLIDLRDFIRLEEKATKGGEVTTKGKRVIIEDIKEREQI